MIMSSGNPFRRSKVESTDYVQPTTPKKSPRKKTKKVQIISPHSSPTDNYKPAPRRLSDGGTGSPPPERNPEDDSDSSDAESTATEDEYIERAIENTRRNSGSDPLSPPMPFPSSSSTAEMPKNPFAKSTRGVAPQVSFGLSTTRTRTNIDLDEENEGPRGEKGATGPAMDVDAFKNMLLTGKAPSPIGTAQGVESGNVLGVADQGESTTKSLVIEPVHDLTLGSPSTAFDDRSASGSEIDDYGGLDDDDTHDHSTLMGSGRSEDIAPALPPKQQPSSKAKKGPQTVSFADFEETIPPPDYGPASPEIARPDPAFWVNRPPLERQGSDLNKPLPPPPPFSSSEQGSQIPAEEVDRSRVSEASNSSTLASPSSTATATATAQSSKKAAPPPPVSRRQGQTSGSNISPQPPPPSQSRARSNSSMDSVNAEIGTTGQVITAPIEAAVKSAAIPPPPPSRRQHNSSLGLTEQTPPQTSEESLPISIEHRTSLSPSPQLTPTNKPMPPPPPRRNPSSKGRNSAVNRTPSNSSRNSLIQNDSTPGSHPASASAPAPAPAPPPPRRGAGHGTASSNRSSLDINQRRASGQSVSSYQSQRSASPSSLQFPKHDGPPAPIQEFDGRRELPRDILADMTAFQKEIDELRARALGNA